MIKWTTQLFKEKLKTVHSDIELVGEFTYINTKIIVKDSLNILYKVKPNDLLRGSKPSILTALDKTDCFIKRAFKLHNNFYSYANTKYIKNKLPVIITCPIHGDFNQLPNVHLLKHGCPECKNTKLRLTKQEFINRSKKSHTLKYDYSKVEFKTLQDIITIGCPNNHYFEQRAYIHMYGSNCPNCLENAGYSKTDWLNFCNNKQNIKPKLYIIKCYNDVEEFVKIGITTRTVRDRFKYKAFLPYSYSIIKETLGSPAYVFDKEHILHRKYKKYSYKPKLNFPGETECFTTKILSLI